METNRAERLFKAAERIALQLASGHPAGHDAMVELRAAVNVVRRDRGLKPISPLTLELMPRSLDSLDLQDLWLAVRVRHRDPTTLVGRVRWAMYRAFYQTVRRFLLVGARGSRGRR